MELKYKINNLIDEIMYLKHIERLTEIKEEDSEETIIFKLYASFGSYKEVIQELRKDSIYISNKFIKEILDLDFKELQEKYNIDDVLYSYVSDIRYINQININKNGKKGRVLKRLDPIYSDKEKINIEFINNEFKCSFIKN